MLEQQTIPFSLKRPNTADPLPRRHTRKGGQRQDPRQPGAGFRIHLL